MPRWQRAYLAICSAIIGFVLAYVLCDYGQWPRLTYFPHEREWHLVSGFPGDIPMVLMGVFFWGVGGAICGALVALVACSLRRRPVTDTWLRLFGAWALAAFAYGGLYYTWNLWPF